MQKNFSIREITQKDSPALLDIKKRSIPQCAPTHSPKDIEMWLAYCDKQNPETCFSNDQGFVAYNDNELIGFVVFSDQDNIGHVDNIFVLSSYRKKGIGSKLFQLAEKELGKQGIEKFTIRATLNAQKFYADFGYMPKEPGIARAGFEILIMEK